MLALNSETININLLWICSVYRIEEKTWKLITGISDHMNEGNCHPPVSRSVSHSLHYSLRETLDIQEDILLSESCKDHQRAAYCSVWHDGALSTGWCTGTGRNIREFTRTGGGDWDQDEPTKHILLCFFFIGILQVTKVSLVALSSSCYHNKLSANVEIYFI